MRSRAGPILYRRLKPKFHYADFATFTETSPRGKSGTLFESATFMICFRDFPRGEVSVKVGVIEFVLYGA